MFLRLFFRVRPTPTSPQETPVKAEVHPKYETTTISCVCGNLVETRSTMPNLRVEICSRCHPFYTGQQRMIDTGGRVERFRRRYGIKA